MAELNKNLKWWITGVAALVVVGGLVAAVALRGPKPDVEKQLTENIQIRVRPVKTIEVPSATSTEERQFTGFAKEGRTIKMSFRVPGPLISFEPVIGQPVEAGTILGKIDPRDFDLAIERVDAGLAEAHAALSAMKTGARVEDIAALEAAVTAAQSTFDTAKKNEERFRNLLSTGDVSQVQYDQVKMLHDQSEAQLNVAKKQLEKGNAGARPEEITAMEAKIEGLEKTRQQAVNARADTELKAPTDGYVSQKYTEQGEIVAPGFPVLAFTSVESIQVEVAIPEEILIRQKDFNGFSCEFEAYPGVKFEATLKEVGQALQPGRQGYPLTVDVVASSEYALHPGMAARLTIQLVRPTVPCVVPYAALTGEIQEKGTGKVWTVVSETKDGVETLVVHGKTVQLVRPCNDGVEITGKDLKPGEKIVGAGARFLEEGQQVRLFVPEDAFTTNDHVEE